MERPTHSIIIKDPNQVTISVAQWLNHFIHTNTNFFDEFLAVTKEFSEIKNSIADVIKPIVIKFEAHGELTKEELLAMAWVLKDAWEMQQNILNTFDGDQKKADEHVKNSLEKLRSQIKSEEELEKNGFKKSSYPNI